MIVPLNIIALSLDSMIVTVTKNISDADFKESKRLAGMIDKATAIALGDKKADDNAARLACLAVAGALIDSVNDSLKINNEFNFDTATLIKVDSAEELSEIIQTISADDTKKH